MHYDFTTIYDRHGMDALAVDGVGSMPGFSPDAPKNGTTFLPMWVADMNFATVPTIPQAIAARIQHPLFGYFRRRMRITRPSSTGSGHKTVWRVFFRSTSATKTAYWAALCQP